MLLRTLLLLLCACFFLPTAEAGDAAPLIEGVVTRHSAFTSGKLNYKWTVSSGEKLDGKEFVFSQDKWVMRTPGQPYLTSNFKGIKYSYGEFPPKPGTKDLFRILSLDFPQSKEDRYAHVDAPFNIGTFWHSSQPDFVLESKDRFLLKESKDLDGVKVQVCELELKNREEVRKGLGAVIPQILDGGILRLYIAPQLGYVLPLVEYLTPDGSLVTSSFKASSFKEYSGLWLPNKFTKTVFFQDRPTTTWDCVVDYSLVNEPVPDSEFIFPLKPNTQIADNVRRLAYTLHSDTTSDAVGAGHFIGEPDPKK